MKKFLTLIICILFLSSITKSQTKISQQLNLDFEQKKNGYPAEWKSFGSQEYKIYLDSTISESGKFSAVIENTDSIKKFRALAIELPDNYKGQIIQLSGFIKTENVTDGYAGLWMRIDPKVAFDNMYKTGIKGSTDWKKYTITLRLDPEITDKITIGGLLVGKGKMWLDNLQVSIDGHDLDDKNIQVYKREISPAALDGEFDSGSNIILPKELNIITVDNLELLGRIWGFLKYYHPEIAQGKYNWDYELFRVLPDYLKAKSIQERDMVLKTWIEKYGKVPICKKCSSTSNDAVLKPDMTWVANSNMSDSLKAILLNIYTNRSQGINYYIGLQESGNPDFKNENRYINMPYPDIGFRLLALYRYWNMIQYFSPYKHLTDKKWNIVLKAYIPKFINATDELEYELVALQMIGELKDTHANLRAGGDKISELRGRNFAPFRASFVENKFVVTDYYNPEYIDTSKLKIGDIITHINGKTIESIVDSLKPYYPASSDEAMLKNISENLLRSAETILNLKYISDNQSKEQEVILYEMNKLNIYHGYKINKDEKCFRILDGNIGYITLATIQQEDILPIKESLKNTKGIVIDIRNYPSTFVPFELGSYFVSQPTPFVKFTKVNIDNPGEFTFREPLNIIPDKQCYKGKLVVLVNENSQSQSEYTAMAFRAVENSIVVGSTTAGADGDTSPIFLPGGLKTAISGIGIYYPNGKETQRIGIVPNITVKPTIEGIKKGKDEILEKAIEIINQ